MVSMQIIEVPQGEPNMPGPPPASPGGDPGRRQQGPRLREIGDVDGMTPEAYREVKTFDQLTPINPESWLRLETGPEPMTTASVLALISRTANG